MILSQKTSLTIKLIPIGILLLIVNTSFAIENPLDSIKEQPRFDSIQTVFQKIQHYQKLVITTNFDTLMVNRRTVAEQPASLVLSGDGQSDLQINIQIKPRGRLRRMKCDLPPIRLNFNKSDLNDLQLYEEYDKLKLVTHCEDTGKNAQVLLKEYWTYKLYNEVSPQSLRVHVLEVSYVHETDPSRRIDSYAFIIENAAEMAHRLNGELIEQGVRSTDLTTSSYHNVLLFNYMIGNTDWKLATQKNLKAVRLKGDSLFTLVPYDFDYSKLVNAPYMKKDQTIPNLDENNRAVIGKILDRAALLKSIELFKSLKKEEFKCYKKCTILKQKEKGYMTYFINTFFQTIKRKNKMEEIFFPIQKESN